MQTFTTVVKKPDTNGRLTIIELPFNAAEVFDCKKGTIRVRGTINGTEYRNKLIPKGKGFYVMSIDKELQKSIGFSGDDLETEVTMELDENALYGSGERTSIEVESCNMDVLTTIKTRRSIRVFTPEDVERSKIDIVLEAGFCAPSAKGKRPWHFLISKDKEFLFQLADNNNYRPLLTANCCIIVCGDKNMEGTTELLIEDCAAAAENILLAAHGLGLGATWCMIFKKYHRFKVISDYFSLPDKIIPIAIIAVGYPAEEKPILPSYDETKVHWDKW